MKALIGSHVLAFSAVFGHRRAPHSPSPLPRGFSLTGGRNSAQLNSSAEMLRLRPFLTFQVEGRAFNSPRGAAVSSSSVDNRVDIYAQMCIYLPVSCEWDPAKARANFEKHGIHFADAATTLEDDLALTVRDPYSEDEDRWITLGKDAAGRLLVVVYT
jgi:ribonuclease toxin BrnT of type II toxin-antitoxin system